MNAVENNASLQDVLPRELSALPLSTAQDRPLAAVLDEVCRLAETLLPGARCSVLLHDTASATLRHGAAPNLPGEFIAAIDHLAVEEGSSACGTAVATGAPVLIEDVLVHPYTARYGAVASAYGLRACWSLPLCAGAAVIGAFAAYYESVRLPTIDELARTQSCARLAALVLEQHAARQAEAETEASFRRAAELLPGHVFIVRPDGQRLYANAYYETQTGIAMHVMQGDGWRSVLHPDDGAATLESYCAALRAGTAWEGRFRIRMGDGTYRWFMCRIRQLHRADGTLAALVGMDVDIDELVTTQQALQEYRAELEQKVAERTRALEETAAELQAEMARREAAMTALAHSQKVEAMGRLTGGVAHDFNNLLSAIMGGFELIEMRAGDAEVQRLARNGLRTCDRAATLVRQLLAVARRDPPAPVWLDPANALPQWRDLIGHALQPRIALEIRLAPDIWPVMVDPAQLETALLNLALNARDAITGPGRLTITAENCPAGGPAVACVPTLLAGDHVLIRVDDTGRGMAPDIVSRIFEPFFTTKKRSEGTGLGLAMVHAFVRQAGGDITVDSRPGQGTVFSLYLPRADRGTARVDGPARFTGAQHRGARILMVDDDEAVRSVAASFLSEAGYRVVEAAGAREALESLRVASADLVVTDLAMPGRDGLELAKEIRAAWPDMKVMFVTGYAEEYHLIGERLLQKPYGAAMLLDAVARAMGEGRSVLF